VLVTTATTATSLTGRRAVRWDPAADVPDWVVLGRISEHLLAGLPVPTDVCPQDDVPAYLPALLAAGHTRSEIARLTGINATRHTRRLP
jgi:hypothetical protein